MKKLIFSVVAAGALAIGGVASAQDLSAVLGSIFGVSPSPYGGIPAVVAGAQPYGSTVYVDPYGRQVYVDQYGRQVQVQPNPYGTSVYGNVVIGYDAYGRPVYGSSSNYAYNDRRFYYRDRDGDGVANVSDRWPDNPNFW